MDFGADGDERLGGRVRAGQSKHLMACLDELPDNRRTDEPRSTGNEDTHVWPFWESERFLSTNLGPCLAVLK